MSDKSSDNDVHAKDFESKMDPMFKSNYVSEYKRRRILDFDEVRSSFVPQPRKLREPKQKAKQDENA